MSKKVHEESTKPDYDFVIAVFKATKKQKEKSIKLLPILRINKK